MPTSDIEPSLRRMGLMNAGDTAVFMPLTGGISSDIHLVEVAGRRLCVKRALARLKVSAVWEAPISRNAAEAAWMRAVGRWLPRAAPEILGEDAEAGLFAMAYLPPDKHPVWKAELMDGRIDTEFAASVGRDLATIHARSTTDATVPGAFAHDRTFEAIRIEPYLRATGRVHPDLAPRFEALAATTLGTKRALVHGDVSPKNILCGPQGPVFLDAECAWYGDPAFDLAFCLNHLLLKGARRGADRAGYVRAFSALLEAYAAGVRWEDAGALETRAAALLPALFLARVDGKSPIEYLTRDEEKNAVRRHARTWIEHPASRLGDIAASWISAS